MGMKLPSIISSLSYTTMITQFCDILHAGDEKRVLNYSFFGISEQYGYQKRMKFQLIEQCEFPKVALWWIKIITWNVSYNSCIPIDVAEPVATAGIQLLYASYNGCIHTTSGFTIMMGFEPYKDWNLGYNSCIHERIETLNLQQMYFN